MMKFFTILLVLSSFTQAFAQDLINSHQHMIFEQAQAKPDTKMVTVHSRLNNQVPGHSSRFIQIEAYGTPSLSFDIPEKQFELEKKIAQSVFVATTGTGTSKGTAFLIGKNLVLTNKHVLASDKDCRKFGVNLNHVQEFVACKEVLYCSPKNDFCLVKVDSMKNGKEIGEEVAPLHFATVKPKSTDMSLLVGNAYALGIQSASYQGIRDFGADWGHFNRAFSGNSGSPLLNAKGEVLGIHYARGGDAGMVGGPKDRMIGMAVKSSTILSEIKVILYKELVQSTLGQKNPLCD